MVFNGPTSAPIKLGGTPLCEPIFYKKRLMGCLSSLWVLTPTVARPTNLGWVLTAQVRPPHPPTWHTYLSYHLYDVTNFQLKLVIILGQVAECHLAPAPPSLTWMGKAKYSDTAPFSKWDFKERLPRHAGKLSWFVSNMLSGTWLEAWQPWSLREREAVESRAMLLGLLKAAGSERHGYEKPIHWCKRQNPTPKRWSTVLP